MGAQDFIIPSDVISAEELLTALLNKWMLRKVRSVKSDLERTQRSMLNFQHMFASLTNTMIRSVSLEEIQREDVIEILRQIGDLVAVDAVSVGFLSDNGELAAENYFNWARKPEYDTSHYLDRGPLQFERDIWSVNELREGRAVIMAGLEDLPPEAAVEREEILRAKTLSSIMMPLRIQNRLRGFLRLSTFEKPRAWNETEIQIARSCADLFTAVLLRWRDLTNLRRTVEALKQRNVEVSTINQMGVRLQRSKNLTELFGVVEQVALELFPAAVGMLQITNKVEENQPMTQWGEWPFSLLVAVEQVFNNIHEEARREGRRSDMDTICKRLGSQVAATNTNVTTVCLPLYAQTETLGLCGMFFPVDYEVTPAVKSLASNFSERVALAIANLQLREDLHYHSIRDPLTDLYNRRFMEHVFENEMRRALRQEEPLSVIMMDVDHFKNVNDTFGHEIGDLVLKAIARFLKHHLRQEDIICRYGGDEFVIILPQAHPTDAYHRAEVLRKAVEEIYRDPLIREFKISGLSLSIGISSYPIHGDQPPELLRAADHALYTSKNHGRNQVRIAPKDRTGNLYRQTRSLNGISGALTESTVQQRIRRKVPLLVATNNKGKLNEIQAIFQEMPLFDQLEFYQPSDLGLNLEVEETGATYAENAALKARAFFAAAKDLLEPLIVIADDSGLEVELLNGRPGIRSARYAPFPNATDADRRRYLLGELKGKTQPWSAHFTCTIALARPDGTIRYYDGTCEGEIISEERGTNGFGYDPVFLLPDRQKTMAEISEADKNLISHRARALRAAIPHIQSLLDNMK
jgi:XTP/dITP diphosphohydrolase